MTDLPANWHKMSLGALWARLNDARRRPTPAITVEAVLNCVRVHGLAALKEPANIERLKRCDAAARAEINKRIGAMLEKGVPYGPIPQIRTKGSELGQYHRWALGEANFTAYGELHHECRHRISRGTA
jgi:hypothetical protein